MPLSSRTEAIRETNPAGGSGTGAGDPSSVTITVLTGDSTVVGSAILPFRPPLYQSQAVAKKFASTRTGVRREPAAADRSTAG